MYESRHKHATVRPRGPDGKFLASNHLSLFQPDQIVNVSGKKRKEEENQKTIIKTKLTYKNQK